jgi:hypothetical protein
LNRWIKRIIYHEEGRRMVKEFPVKASKSGRVLTIAKEPTKEICDFVKSVDYKMGAYREQNEHD